MSDGHLAERCRLWRNHGQTVHEGARDAVLPGMNYRMTELQAAIGAVQLQKLPHILAKRRALAEQYRSRLSGRSDFALPPASPEHTWQTFMVVLAPGIERSCIAARLSARGVEAGPGSVAAHGLQTYRDRFGDQDADLPVSTRLNDSGLALPLHAAMTGADVSRVCTELLAALEQPR